MNQRDLFIFVKSNIFMILDTVILLSFTEVMDTLENYLWSEITNVLYDMVWCM